MSRQGERRRGALRDLLRTFARPVILDSTVVGVAAAPPLTVQADETLYRSQAARGEARPRRYVGRSRSLPVAAGRTLPPGATWPEASHAAADVVPPRSDAYAHIDTVPARWSLRLTAAAVLLCGLALGLRFTGLWTLPLDPPVGSESTQAAFARTLAGSVEGTLDPVRLFPPTAPWSGPAPANPVAGVPLNMWLTAAVMHFFGAGDWIGRAIATLVSLVAGLSLFGLIRRTAGARAGLYALLFFGVVPLSVTLGQHYSNASVIMALQALAVSTLVNWRLAASGAPDRDAVRAFSLALLAGVCVALVDPASIFLAVPAGYLTLVPVGPHSLHRKDDFRPTRGEAPNRGLRQLWGSSPYRVYLLGYCGVLLLTAAVWRLMMADFDATLPLGAGDVTSGPAEVVTALLNGGTYVQVVGTAMEKLLTIFGACLLLAGLVRGARIPFTMLFHFWLFGGLLHVLADSGRLARHDDMLLPLVLPVCALVGIGAAWAGSLPTRVWEAISEQRRENESEYVVSPHTAWLLDLPEERSAAVGTQKVSDRPQAHLALGRSVAERARRAGASARRTWIMGFGNVLVLAAIGWMVALSWPTLQARLQPSAAIEFYETGHQIATATRTGSRLIIAGPAAPGLFYGARRTGWAISEGDFDIVEVQRLERQGAEYLVSTDQEWLGRHPDYVGLLTNYSVARLGRGYILFDLTTKPAANDRLYFLESGHTLGGKFRRYWEQHGGVSKLGYPISEELEEANPLDGQKRTVQYFERAVLELHPEFAGTPDEVMQAAVGRWVTVGRQFPKVDPFASTEQRAYFPETGHSVKEAFLRFWQREGGVANFGYPISEELPEINPADGKVYTVQYFERARFEWHPTEAGTLREVQLGLIGKQAWERKR